ncbi:hypothetical protein HD597_007641 [Nonomuraea thailandensis]|uniref:Uncharacterized protein n=1 Tax=Nonomuraea thailandensis TaxID=1188745 RepID=A0A9X2GKP9_9ACTN|nr:hypothetical protein [Nonomuraea thailandensis]MCP2360621.1 hypothetical protein [Nonomuraea thailandensis]
MADALLARAAEQPLMGAVHRDERQIGRQHRQRDRSGIERGPEIHLSHHGIPKPS